MADNQPSFGVGGSAGATVQSQYMGRTMKCFPVYQTEMDTLSTLNAQASAFFAIAAALVGYASSIWINAVFYSSLTPMGQLATHLAAPSLILIALVFVGLGIHATCKRKGIWKRIETEAYSLSPPVS